MSDTDIFIPPGPVAQAFFEAGPMPPIQALMGPVGSGKTTTGLMRWLPMSYMLHPSSDGIRYAKAFIMRRVFKDLEGTTMKSWHQWWPRTVGKWTGDPPVHELTVHHPADGGLINFVAEFLALGDLRMEEAVRGREATWAIIDEMDGMTPDGMPFLFDRLGRYHRECGGHLRCIWGMTNAPEDDNWFCNDFIDDPKPGHKLWRQPSGLSSQAENLHNLPAGYYDTLHGDTYYRRRFVECIPGLSRGTDPVYPEFDEDMHMARAPLVLLPTRITIGLDAGGTPAAGTWQTAPNGQLRKLRELTTHEKVGGSITGPERFGEALAAQLHALMQSARGMREPEVIGFADPSAAHGADTVNGESNWMEIVAAKAGIRVFSARTNDPTPRQEVYRHYLRAARIDGSTAAMLIDPSCTFTRRALQRDYRYGAIAGQNARRTDKPLKNWASHMIEADQYALLDTPAYFAVMGRADRRRSGQRAARPLSFNLFQKVG